jgi:pimeloyl-ACP methyl ester carboxylesterase
MYMTPDCWGAWIDLFRANGRVCSAPAWPGRDKPVAVLRRNHSDPELGRLTLRAVLDHLSGLLQGMEEKPILIGHSMGGLIVQILLQRGLGSAAVAIHSAPPPGVFSAEWSFVKSNWPHITPFAPRGEPIRMSFEQFQYAFVNTLPPEEQRAAYDAFVVPESRRVPAQSLTGIARIDFTQSGPPLLLTAGSADNIIPASLNRRNFSKYRRPGSITEFREFTGRTHFVLGQRNWEEVARFILTWLERNGL